MAENPVDRFLSRQAWMDAPAGLIQKLVLGFYKILGPVGRLLRDLAHGRPFGHPLHPALTDIPVGAWVIVLILDIAGHYTATIPHSAATLVLLIGIVGAAGAAATGYTDFADTVGHERRLGFAHGLLMTVVLILMVVSLVLRHWGGESVHSAAVVLSTIGVVIMSGSAWIGGHLVFSLGTMVNRNAFTSAPSKFTDIGAVADFPEGKMKRAKAGAMPVVVTRRNGALCAIGAVCSHAGGPLDEGALEGGVVQCPWHGSKFDVCTGSVKAGPATMPQPVLEIREHEGRVEVKAAKAAH